MIHDLPGGARRAQDFLINSNSNAQVMMLPDSCATSQEAADTLGVPIAHIGKSIVFGAGDKAVVAIICGNLHIDQRLLAESINVTKVDRLSAKEVKYRTGYVIGGVSPFGLQEDTFLVIDKQLESLPNCYVAAGHPKAVVKTSFSELVKLTNAIIADIAKITK